MGSAVPTLPDEAFAAWWMAIDPLDKNDFLFANGGDIPMARFVCALDTLLIEGSRREVRKGTEIEAYAMAYDCGLEEAKKKYRAVLQHDAVAGLLERIGARERALSAIAIDQAYGRVVNKLLGEAADLLNDQGPSILSKEDIKLIGVAVKAANDFTKRVDSKQMEERIERTKRGVQRGREAMLNEVDVTPEDAARMLVMVKERLGSAGFSAVLAGLGEDTRAAALKP